MQLQRSWPSFHALINRDLKITLSPRSPEITTYQLRHGVVGQARIHLLEALGSLAVLCPTWLSLSVQVVASRFEPEPGYSSSFHLFLETLSLSLLIAFNSSLLFS